jgi:hypothetical protein
MSDSGNRPAAIPPVRAVAAHAPELHLHPAWRALMRLCVELGHGEIERLTIQDGLPIVAQVIKKKVKLV